MERKKVVLGFVAMALAACLTTAASAQDKKKGGADASVGPYGLPTLDAVETKVKPSDDEKKKLEEIYATATKNEAESKTRSKENGTDQKTLQSYLTIGRNETVNKVKEALDKDKGKAFDELCAASQPVKKKK
ncbi:MAG TPA: hypothetical protein VE981_05175 [Planctomycetota bacterium]|nr:hypothetical protein [Planctomycetota bacterium]